MNLQIKPKDNLFAMANMDILAAEQYRVLYTRLENFHLKNMYKTFAITSSAKGEGKTITSLNLAYVIAHDFSKKVIVVECDLKKPSISSYFMASNERPDLLNVLTGKIDVNSAIAQVENTGLYLLTARPNIKNSCELLGSKQMEAVLSTLKKDFDYIILDTPPLLPLADMNVLSKIVDGLILVVRAGNTPKDIVLKGAHSIHNANILGVVLNAADSVFKKYYY